MYYLWSTAPTLITPDPAVKKLPPAKIDKKTVARVLEVVDHGLVEGMGVAEPGKFCVEAAVCYALGEPHSDKPSCVHDTLRWFKIGLNDCTEWASEKDRARGLRELAVAQLGTARGEFDGKDFLWRLHRRLGTTARFYRNLLADTSLNAAAVAALSGARTAAEFENTLDAWTRYSNSVEAVGYEWEEVAGGDVRSILDYLGLARTPKDLRKIAAAAVAVLEEMKTPGSKFLYLARQARPKKVAKKVAPKKKAKVSA